MFFIIVGTQVGVGIMGVPKYIFKEAQQDSWISILIAFVYMAIVVMVMFVILNQYDNADVFGIQVDVFGKWVGKVLGTIYIIYFILGVLSILLSYIHVIRLFIYPTMPLFVIGLLLLSLVVYSVLGGIRVIVGVTFVFFFLSLWVVLLLYDPITRMEMTHFQPMFQTSMTELLHGARETSYTLLGIEMLFVIFPFIENKEKAKTSAILGISFTTLLVLVTMIISIGYYGPQEFEKVEWAVLRLFKSISMPMLERFDYFVIVEWMMVVIPTMILLMWAATHGAKRLYAIKQKTTLYSITVMLLILVSFIRYEAFAEQLADIISHIGFWLVFVYPFVLLPIVLVKNKWRKAKEGEK